jgi:hypothetical protein
MALKCKYCGNEVKNNGTYLNAPSRGENCGSSPNKKHVAVPDGEHCVFCGREVKAQGSNLNASGAGTTCNASPSKKHQLDD